MTALEGQTLGPYEVRHQMGSGGMATVYKAYHSRLDRHVAIKVLHEAFQQDENFLARFEREAQIVARLEHPNIVPIYDFADINGRPYLVMKHIEGQTLKSFLFRSPPTLETIRQILPPIADALDYAHRQGILHRDIKPSNIIIDAQGTPYLTDFGLARIAQLGESTLSQDVILGTPQYISPEQAMGKRDLTPATDLYSLGVVLYEMVVGQVPFSSDTPFAIIHDHIYRALPTPSEINPELPPAINTVLEKALAKRPDERYDTATAMIAAFLEALAASNLASLNPNRRAVASEAGARRRPSDSPDGLSDEAPTTPLPADQARQLSQRQGTGPQQILQPPTPPQPPGRERPKRKVEATLDLGDINWGQLGQRFGSVIEEVAESVEKAVDPQPVDALLSRDSASIRRRVEEEFKKRRELISHIVVFGVVQVILWAIWAAASDFTFEIGAETIRFGSFPWPLIVFFGWGSGLLAHAVETFYDTGRRLRRRAEAVERELIRTYGDNWSAAADKKAIKALRKRVEAPYKKVSEFFQHAGVYVMINLMLWFIFFQSNGDGIPLPQEVFDFMQNMPFPWPLLVTAGWGIGLVINGFEAFFAGSHERAVQREIAREESRLLEREYAKPKRSAEALLDAPTTAERVRLTEDGEFTDSLIEEMEREDRRGRRRR
ncbi:MAG: protein kinase [Anaerolineae bacterium]|nr:protein kinase [Anaerolineae bacterium]